MCFVKARSVLTSDLPHIFTSVSNKVLVTGALEGSQQVSACAVVQTRVGFALIDVKFTPANFQYKYTHLKPH